MMPDESRNHVKLTTGELLAKRQAQIDLEQEQEIERLRAKALKLLDYLFDQRLITKCAFNAGVQMGKSHNSLIVRQIKEHNQTSES